MRDIRVNARSNGSRGREIEEEGVMDVDEIRANMNALSRQEKLGHI